MSGFEVNVEDISSYANQIFRSSSDVEASVDYLDKYCRLGMLQQGTLMELVEQANGSVYSATRQLMQRLIEVTGDSTDSLLFAASYYTRAEKESAERADAAYPAVERLYPMSRPDLAPQIPILRNVPDAQEFGDIVIAQNKLMPPDPPNVSEIERQLKNPGSVFDYFSPANAVLQVVKLITGADVVEDFIKIFAGDWEAVHIAGTAYGNIGLMVSAIAANIKHGNSSLDQTWHGNASDAAYQYFEKLHVQLEGQTAGYEKLMSEYRAAAEGVARLADTAAGVIRGIIDDALIAAAAAYAGAVTIETGVGAVVGWTAAALEAERIWGKYKRLTILQRTAIDVINTLVGAANSMVASSSAFQRFPLPEQPYRHPAE